LEKNMAKPTAEERDKRKRRARWLKTFRREHFFTQSRLASVTGVGRRTIQTIEAAGCTPRHAILATLQDFVRTHEREQRRREEREVA
jgi:DNA-binding XRE family transcriptional regulator